MSPASFHRTFTILFKSLWLSTIAKLDTMRIFTLVTKSLNSGDWIVAQFRDECAVQKGGVISHSDLRTFRDLMHSPSTPSTLRHSTSSITHLDIQYLSYTNLQWIIRPSQHHQPASLTFASFRFVPVMFCTCTQCNPFRYHRSHLHLISPQANWYDNRLEHLRLQFPRR